jgi:hypothetical protein
MDIFIIADHRDGRTIEQSDTLDVGTPEKLANAMLAVGFTRVIILDEAATEDKLLWDTNDHRTKH